MNLLYYLNEDKIAKLPVLLSSEVEDFIEAIDHSNRFNEKELVQFYYDLEGLIAWVSNNSIAWDNSNNFRHFNNGTTYFERFGFKMTYVIKVNETTHQSFVYILTLKFNFDDYGLQIPPYITENNNNTKRQNTMKQKIRLTEGDLHRIVRQCVNEALNELDWKTYANASKKAYNRGTDYWREKGRKGFDAIHDTAMSKIRAERFGSAADDAFDRDYGYQQGELGDDNYQRVGMGGEFGSTEEFGPHAAGWKRGGYWGTTRFPYGIHCHQRTPEEFFDGNDDAVDAYKKAKEEMENFKKGNYDYIKGKGYQLKN